MPGVAPPETSHPITVLATEWCSFCSRLRADLDKADTPYHVIDIEHDEQAGRWVESVNGGNRIVPTVLFSDGTHITNPSAPEVSRKYEQLEA